MKERVYKSYFPPPLPLTFSAPVYCLFARVKPFVKCGSEYTPTDIFLVQENKLSYFDKFAVLNLIKYFSSEV